MGNKVFLLALMVILVIMSAIGVQVLCSFLIVEGGSLGTLAIPFIVLLYALLVYKVCGFSCKRIFKHK